MIKLKIPSYLVLLVAGFVQEQSCVYEELVALICNGI